MSKKYDFSGWATRANVLCSDGRVIKRDAFKDCDGKVVPLVWNHQHNDPTNILGHALLQNRGDGVYAYCTFNGSDSGQTAKMLVEHGDISSLSILANQLKQNGSDVIHGNIREVSLVLAGANPKAFIDDVISHSDDPNDEGTAIMSVAEPIDLEHGEIVDDSEESISHADNSDDSSKDETIADVFNTLTDKQKNAVYAIIGQLTDDDSTESMSHADNSDESNKDETVADVFNTLTDKQKNVVYAIIGQLIDDENSDGDEATHSDNFEGGNNNMKYNVFDQQGDNELQHNGISLEAQSAIIGDAKRYGSMKESFLQHAATYGIEQIDYLFPDEKNVTNTPIFIQRDTSWVRDLMGSVHHTPFSRIKSLFADITEDEARAKGYFKGNLKKEEVFSLLKRTTMPTTVYKKQKMDRDDQIDITDFDVVAWLKTEMRGMLDEEIARAVLVGDGRLASSDDKINEQNIRPIWTDSDLFTVKAPFAVSAGASDDDKAKAFIKACIKARKNYKGSGNPILFTTEDVVTDCLLLTDSTGRDLYESADKLATKLRVRKIVTVPVMEGLTRTGSGDDSGSTYSLYGIIVNPVDYNVGADKGGAINMFDDFDIDYNQQKYLIETRCSGALIRPYSAIAVELKANA